MKIINKISDWIGRLTMLPLFVLTIFVLIIFVAYRDNYMYWWDRMLKQKE